MNTEMRSVYVIAKREFLDAIRDRWFFFFAVLFILLDSTVAYSGIVSGGGNTFLKTSVSFLMLSLIFLSIASLVSITLGEKAKSIGISFMVWFWFVIIYDFILVGLTLAYGELIIALLFLNPADLVRTTLLTSLGSAALVGPAGAVLSKTLGSFTGMIISSIALLAWLLIPLLVALFIFERKDI